MHNGTTASDRGSLRNRLARMAGRARRIADLPGMLQHLRFARLRRRYNAAMWRRAAREIGADCAPLPSGFTRISRAGMTTLVRGGEVMLDSRLTLDLMGDKPLVYDLLREKGAPVPDSTTFSRRDLGPALAFMRAQSAPVVVKPASGTGGGRGVTTGVIDERGLRRAARNAARFDAVLVAEREIEGGSYRLLFLHGRLLDAVRRDPPLVTGDGRRTIRQLIAAENARRLEAAPARALSPITIDPDCRTCLGWQGLTPRSRPAEGAVIQVKSAANENAATENHNVRDDVHPDTVALCRDLVCDFGVALAGVDILCRDISRPLGPDNGVIGEINTTPGLHHHYLVRDPAAAVPVASIVLEDILSSGRGALDMRKPPLQETEQPGETATRAA